MHTIIVAEEGVWPTVGKEGIDLHSSNIIREEEELTTHTRSSQGATFDFFFRRDEVKIIKTQFGVSHYFERKRTLYIY